MELLEANPWLKGTKLVVKPDMLFGKRGKHDLVGLNLDFQEVNNFVKVRMNKVIDMNGCVGPINTFIVEPFVPHDQEFYLCLQVRLCSQFCIVHDVVLRSVLHQYSALVTTYGSTCCCVWFAHPNDYHVV